MTEHDLAIALDRISASVQSHRVDLGEKIATLTANVGTLQTSHEANAKKLDEVYKLELSCAARAGFDGALDRLAQLEDDSKVRVESELQAARDEITGRVDVENRDEMEAAGISNRHRRWSDTRSTVFRALALKAVPYVLFGLVALGAYLASGGDTEATARALRAVSDAVARVDSKIEKVEAKVDEVSDDTGAAAAVVNQ
jgi:hypothetical protein